jgi:hypothetical protein
MFIVIAETLLDSVLCQISVLILVPDHVIVASRINSPEPADTWNMQAGRQLAGCITFCTCLPSGIPISIRQSKSFCFTIQYPSHMKVFQIFRSYKTRSSCQFMAFLGSWLSIRRVQWRSWLVALRHASVAQWPNSWCVTNLRSGFTIVFSTSV